MKTAIILHGMPSKEEYYSPKSESMSNKHWFPWLQRQLLLKDILAQTPEMPKAYEPDYKEWCKVFEQFSIDEETILVGHSCGAGFLVRWISENDIKVGKVVLVAPWLDPEKMLTNGFFDFEIDKKLISKTNGLTILGSDNDEWYIPATIKTIRDTLPEAKYIEIPGYGHFVMSSMKSREFPELLDIMI